MNDCLAMISTAVCCAPTREEAKAIAEPVAFRWMEIEGPLYDDATLAGYQLLFGDLPLREVEDGTSGGVAISYIRPGDRREGGRNAGTRVEPIEDLFVEVNHGPFLVDNNLLLSNISVLVNSQGGAYAHMWALQQQEQKEEEQRLKAVGD